MPDLTVRRLRRTGAALVVAGAAGVLLLHVLPPTSAISPVRRTISEYALTSLGWVFAVSVAALALGSAAVFAAFGRARRLGPAAAICGTAWVVGLLVLIRFPKHDWALGPVTGSGQVHRLASLVAFLALPVAALLIARAGRGRPAARAVAILGVISLAWFTAILATLALHPARWWQVIPLGLVERGLALTEVAAVLALAVLAAPLAVLADPLPATARSEPAEPTGQPAQPIGQPARPAGRSGQPYRV